METYYIPERLLKQVTKPARYIGGEKNVVIKEMGKADVNFLFCFPDAYEIGMSCLGLQIMYFFLNRRSDTYCQRAFAPWTDMERLMRENGYELFALESQEPARCFDFLGFTLQYELSYTAVLNMLELAGIPEYAADRDDTHPIICAGGPCAYNPEPLADFIDFFYLGEGEAVMDEVLDLYIRNKGEGGSKNDFLKLLLNVPGIYVPCFYQPVYDEYGKISAINKLDETAPDVVQKVIVKELDSSFYLDRQLVPIMETVHDRVTLETFRGCLRGCRFCQAGYVTRPVRESDYNRLLEQADSLFKCSGYDEVSLISLSTSDYQDIVPLANGLMERYAENYVNISLPSMRVDKVSVELMNRVQEVRKSSVTFAPEAGTQRLRDVINKSLTREEILEGCKLAFMSGFDRIKLYFMIGLPTETDEDLLGIQKLAAEIVGEFYKLPRDKRPRPVTINVSASAFVPKPFTAFQWDAQDSVEEFARKQQMIKRTFSSSKNIKFTYHDSRMAVIEGALARGDRRLGKVIYNASKNGVNFDGWTEFFSFDVWRNAFSSVGLDMDFYNTRKRAFDEILPWQHLSVGVSGNFLADERRKADLEQTTVNCRDGCAGCGAFDFDCCGKETKIPNSNELPDDISEGQRKRVTAVNAVDKSAAATTYRFRFTKTGYSKYIGHLDLMRIWQQALRMVGLPVKYSHGFNPHMLMSFAAPLALGYESECEYVEVEMIERDGFDLTDATATLCALNQSLPGGINVKSVLPMGASDKSAAALCLAADYEIRIPNGHAFIDDKYIMDYLDKPEILMSKKTKAGINEVNIRNDIFSVAIAEVSGGSVTLSVRLSAGSKRSIKPELFMQSFCPEGDLFEIHYKRTSMLKDDGNGGFIKI